MKVEAREVNTGLFRPVSTHPLCPSFLFASARPPSVRRVTKEGGRRVCFPASVGATVRAGVRWCCDSIACATVDPNFECTQARSHAHTHSPRALAARHICTHACTCARTGTRRTDGHVRIQSHKQNRHNVRTRTGRTRSYARTRSHTCANQLRQAALLEWRF